MFLYVVKIFLSVKVKITLYFSCRRNIDKSIFWRDKITYESSFYVIHKPHKLNYSISFLFFYSIVYWMSVRVALWKTPLRMSSKLPESALSVRMARSLSFGNMCFYGLEYKRANNKYTCHSTHSLFFSFLFLYTDWIKRHEDHFSSIFHVPLEIRYLFFIYGIYYRDFAPSGVQPFFILLFKSPSYNPSKYFIRPKF